MEPGTTKFQCFLRPHGALILFLADLFHPIDDFAIQLFLDGDVHHRRCWRGAVPVFLAGREPDDITGTNLFDGPGPSLRSSAARRDDQRLPEGMGMPRGAGARLKGYAGTLD